MKEQTCYDCSKPLKDNKDICILTTDYEKRCPDCAKAHYVALSSTGGE